MGANPTQAVGILLMFVAFVLLAGAFAGGGIITAVLAVVLLGVSLAVFKKCKPWEHQKE
jgi:hypothetical protein